MLNISTVTLSPSGIERKSRRSVERIGGILVNPEFESIRFIDTIQHIYNEIAVAVIEQDLVLRIGYPQDTEHGLYIFRSPLKRIIYGGHVLADQVL